MPVSFERAQTNRSNTVSSHSPVISSVRTHPSSRGLSDVPSTINIRMNANEFDGGCCSWVRDFFESIYNGFWSCWIGIKDFFRSAYERTSAIFSGTNEADANQVLCERAIDWSKYVLHNQLGFLERGNGIGNDTGILFIYKCNACPQMWEKSLFRGPLTIERKDAILREVEYKFRDWLQTPNMDSELSIEMLLYKRNNDNTLREVSWGHTINLRTNNDLPSNGSANLDEHALLSRLNFRIPSPEKCRGIARALSQL